jgi:acyl dehydratase
LIALIEQVTRLRKSLSAPWPNEAGERSPSLVLPAVRWITEVGTSEWIEVTQDRINKFAEATCDEQWIHVDQERAQAEMPGGKTITHGLLSLSLTPMFIRSVMGLKGLKNTLNYGADRIRYLSPVPAGSKLRGRVSVAEAEEVPPHGLRVHYRVVIEIEGGQRPACVAEVIGLHYR